MQDTIDNELMDDTLDVLSEMGNSLKTLMLEEKKRDFNERLKQERLCLYQIVQGVESLISKEMGLDKYSKGTLASLIYGNGLMFNTQLKNILSTLYQAYLVDNPKTLESNFINYLTSTIKTIKELRMPDAHEIKSTSILQTKAGIQNIIPSILIDSVHQKSAIILLNYFCTAVGKDVELIAMTNNIL